MDEIAALDCLAALAQPTRLKAFRLLLSHEPEGIAAGEIARMADVPQNTMSAHLATLSACGLIASERQSRSIVYRADLDHVRALMAFLLQDCCGGRIEICAPIIAGLAPCCPPSPKRKMKRTLKRKEAPRA